MVKFDSSQTDPTEVEQLRDQYVAGTASTTESDPSAVTPKESAAMPENTSDFDPFGSGDGHGDQAGQATGPTTSQDPATPGRAADAPATEAEADPLNGFGRHGSGHTAPEQARSTSGDTRIMPPVGDWNPSAPKPPQAPPLEPDDAPPVSFVLPDAAAGRRAAEPPTPTEADPAETTVQYDRGASGGHVTGATPTQGPGRQRADAPPALQRPDARPQRPGSTPTPPPAPPWPRQSAPAPRDPGTGPGRASEQPSRQVQAPYPGVAGPNPQIHPGNPRGYTSPEATPRPTLPATPQASPFEYGAQTQFGAERGERPQAGYDATAFDPAPPRVPSAASFDEERSLHGSGDFAVESGRREGPQQGWRSFVSRMGIPVGKGPAELEYDHDIVTINKRLRYRKTVGVVAFKGGVGKTAMVMTLASTVAAHRQDGGVVAIDTVARGTLAMRVKGEQPADGHVKALAYDENLHTISDVRAHLMSNPHRLSVLGSHRDLVDEPLSPQEYLHSLNQLHRHHEIVFVDTEPSVATPTYGTIMASLDALILVVNPSRDSAIPGREVLPWLRAHGLSELAERTIVLLNHTSPAKPHMNEEVITNHFHNNERVEVLAIPYDAHLAEAGAISLGLLDKTTRRQFVSAAAILLDKLPAT